MPFAQCAGFAMPILYQMPMPATTYDSSGQHGGSTTTTSPATTVMYGNASGCYHHPPQMLAAPPPFMPPYYPGGGVGGGFVMSPPTGPPPSFPMMNPAAAMCPPQQAPPPGFAANSMMPMMPPPAQPPLVGAEEGSRNFGNGSNLPSAPSCPSIGEAPSHDRYFFDPTVMPGPLQDVSAISGVSEVSGGDAAEAHAAAVGNPGGRPNPLQCPAQHRPTSAGGNVIRLPGYDQPPQQPTSKAPSRLSSKEAAMKAGIVRAEDEGPTGFRGSRGPREPRVTII